MLKQKADLQELDILYVRDIEFPLYNEGIDLYIKEDLDGTYQIFKLPSFYWGYHSDFHNRLAYSFNALSDYHQQLHQDKVRKMVQNGNGSYYEKCKKYTRQ